VLLEGRRVIVTGASRGIGRAIALACAQEGAKVGLNYLKSHESAKALADTNPDQFHLLPFDVSDAASATEAIDRFGQEWGGIDALVNNAGIFFGAIFVRAPLDETARIVAVNLLGPLICSKAVLPFMIKARAGSIVNISSVAAVNPIQGQAVYAATKGALEALTRSLAVEYRSRNVRVVAVRPGPVATDMLAQTHASTWEYDSGEPGVATSEDIGQLVLDVLCCSDEYPSGAIIGHGAGKCGP